MMSRSLVPMLSALIPFARGRGTMRAAEISRLLGERVDRLVRDLLPGGRVEGAEWRCGSVAGQGGRSLGVRLYGSKAGVWADFAAGIGGDPLDLVAAVHGVRIGEAINWSARWLEIENGAAVRPSQPGSRA